MNPYYEAKALESIKDQALYDFINPAESRKIGTTPFKKKIDAIIKTDKIDKSKISAILKQIESGSKSSGMKLQKHITLPAAVFLTKNNKKVNTDVIETCIRAQKDYFYKSLPKKENDIDVVSKKLIQQLGNNKDISANQIAFAAYYRWGINKILASKNINDAFTEFPKIIQDEVSELSDIQKQKYFSRLQSSVRPYTDSEIINKAMREFNTLGEKTNINSSKLNEIKDIALTAIIDDEVINREISIGTSELTRETIGSRKEIKKAEKVKQLKAEKDSGSITKDDLDRMLSAIPGYDEIQKEKRKKVEDIVLKTANKRSETIEKLLELQKKRSDITKEKGNNWKDRVSKVDKQIKELSKSIGASSSAELWSDLRKNVNSVIGNLLDEKPKDQIVKAVKKSMNPKMSDNSMDFMKDLMGESYIREEAEDLNSDGEIDDYEISFYNFLNDLRKSRLPKGIIEIYSVPQRHQEACEKCQNLLYDYWVDNELHNIKSEIKSEMIRKKYAEISRSVFDTIADDQFLNDTQFAVLKGGKELNKFEKERDAKEFVNSLIQKHMNDKPGIPSSIIRNQYGIKKY